MERGRMTSTDDTPWNRSTCRAKCGGILRQNLLVTLTFVGVGVGLLVGFTMAPTNPSTSTLMWIGMAGELYIRMLKMMIVPLVVCSIISGTAELDPRSNGKIGAVSLLWIMTTNLVGGLLGALLCMTIRPGKGVESGALKFDKDLMETEDIFADLLRNIFPDNIVAACFEQAQTKYEFASQNVTSGNVTVLERVVTAKSLGAAKSTNILGLVIISAVFGVGSATMGEKGEPFLNFFRSSTDLIIRILRVVIWSTPVGVASLIAKTIAGTGDLEDTFRKLGMYTLTLLLGQIFFGVVAMPLVFFYVRRKNPFRFLASIVPSMLIVFATSSTVMALPESFHALETKNGVDKRISRFVAPLSATIGRAGSANYIAVSCFFLIQLLALETNFANAFLVIILTWVSALAIPSVTGASLVTVLILLTALNIPGESAAMLFALEFLLDRSRSVCNVITQLTGVVVTQRYCASSLHADNDAELADDVEEKGALMNVKGENGAFEENGEIRLNGLTEEKGGNVE